MSSAEEEERPLDHANQAVLLRLISQLVRVNEEVAPEHQLNSDEQSMRKYLTVLTERRERERQRAARAVAHHQELKMLLARMKTEQMERAEALKVDDAERTKFIRSERPRLQSEYESKKCRLRILEEEIEDLKRSNMELTKEIREKSRIGKHDGPVAPLGRESLSYFLSYLDSIRSQPAGRG
jgi:hypothetical protein